MGHNSSGGRTTFVEDQILTYMAKCRNENLEQFRAIMGKLEENGEAIRELKEDFMRFKEHSASVNSWADVYEYDKEEKEDIPGASPSRGNYFRRHQQVNVEGHDASYDSTSQEEISVDEEHGIVKVDESADEVVVAIETEGGNMEGSSREEGGNTEQGDDDEVQILNEVIVNGKTEAVEPGPSSKMFVGSNSNHSGIGRRVSYFTPVKRARTDGEGPGPSTSQSEPLQMPDLSKSFGLDSIYNQGTTPESSIDGDLADVNEIFDDVSDSTDPPPPILSPAVPKRKNKSNDDNQRERMIKRIAKAPIKEEPNQLHSSSFLPDDMMSFSDSPQHTLPSPPPSNREEDAEDGGNHEQPEPAHPQIIPIQRIKVERVAHAIRDKQPVDGRYYCICGHFVLSKCGINAHVKHKGCEEPRFFCPEEGCDKKFLEVYNVRHHLLNVHGKNYPKLYGCYKCSTYFEERMDYKTHRDLGSCKKISSRRKGQAVELNRAPVTAPSPGTSSATSTLRGLPPQSSASGLGRPSQIITMN